MTANLLSHNLVFFKLLLTSRTLIFFSVFSFLFPFLLFFISHHNPLYIFPLKKKKLF